MEAAGAALVVLAASATRARSAKVRATSWNAAGLASPAFVEAAGAALVVLAAFAHQLEEEQVVPVQARVGQVEVVRERDDLERLAVHSARAAAAEPG